MSSVFKSQLPADVAGVLKTAALLDTTEYRVFELAYRDWYGNSANATEIERFFTTYMFTEIVPLWVRQFTRKTIEHTFDQGVTVDDMLEPTADSPDIAKGVRFLLAVVSILTFMLIIAGSSDYLSSITKECYFPPCY